MASLVGCYPPLFSQTPHYRVRSLINDKELEEITNYNFPEASGNVVIKKAVSGLPFKVAFNPVLNKIYVIGNKPLEKNNVVTIKLCFDPKNPQDSLIYKRSKGILNETERKINCLLSAQKNLFIATDEIYEEKKELIDSVIVKSGMVLEHMDWSLRTLLEKKDLSIKSRVSILIDILTALIALHEQEIVHLDLNWNNILLDVESLPRDNGRKYHTKIADFGTSAFVGNIIKCGKTPFFAAPEVRECKKNESTNDLKVEAPSTAKCSIDMWNFGVIALLMIGKKETWKAWQEVCRRNELFPTFSLRGSEVYNSLINEAVTSNLYTIPIKTIVVNVVDHCLKLDPEKRITAIKAKEELVKAQEMLNEIYKGIS